MAEKSFSIQFNNYIKDGEFDQLPDRKGIYAMRITTGDGTGWHIKDVIYIGKAEIGLKNRLNETHEHLKEARELAKKVGGFLTFAFTDENDDLEDDKKLARIEEALIFDNKPKLNTSSTKSFNHDKTTVYVSGTRRTGINKISVVERTSN